MASSLTDIERGNAAHTALRKNMVELVDGVTVGAIPTALYSKELIEEDTWEFLQCEKTNSQKGDKIVRNVQKTVRLCPDMLETLCQILSHESITQDLAKDIHVTYERELEMKVSSGCRRHLKTLMDELSMVKSMSQRVESAPSPEAIEECQKGSIRHYLDNSFVEEVPLETLKSELSSVYTKKMLINRSLYEWACGELKQLSAKQIASLSQSQSAVAEVKPKEPPSLFGQSTLYHASLCCCAVLQCRDEAHAHRYFSDVRHKLTQVSICKENSAENLDRYLIARSDDIIYVAFQSEMKLLEWLKKYRSFPEGIQKQTEKVPVRFLLEQMLKDQKIVLTGFSFGGILACSIAAKLLRETFDLNLLQRNLCCITFGQPIITLPFVQTAIRMFPAIENTFHCIYDKEDHFPEIMHYYNVGCTIAGIQLIASQQNSLPSDTKITDFSGEFSSNFLHSLGTVQELNVAYSKVHETDRSAGTAALTKLKTLLTKIITHLNKLGRRPHEATSGLFGCIHLMAIEGKEGLVGRNLALNSATEQLLNLDQAQIDKLDTTLFRKHSMESYRSNSCQVLFPKCPRESLTKMSVQSVDILKPILHSIEFHLYPDQHVVVIQGDNLWFCHKIKLGSKKPLTIDSPSNVMSRSVQYNCKTTSKTRKLAEEDYIHVYLRSHFHEIEKDIASKQEPYVFTLRQKQLAKHTPTELIKLAYYIAMLERPLPSTQTATEQSLLSKRFEAVVRYLEEAAKIVPLESVFYAITHSDDGTALKCCKALQSSSSLEFPASQMMLIGSQNAADRAMFGEEYIKQYIQAMSIPIPFPTFPAASFVSQEHQTLNSPPQPSKGNPRVTPSSAGKKLQYADIAKARTPHQHYRSHFQREIYSVPVPVPIVTAQPSPLDESAAVFLDRLACDITVRCKKSVEKPPVLSRRSIEHFCPFSPKREVVRDTKLKSPVQALVDARSHLIELVDELNLLKDVESAMDINTKMSQEVREIEEGVVNVCAALLAAFMEQQIQIPLLSSHISTAAALSTISPVVMGVWAFVSMGKREIEKVLNSAEGQSFKIEIEDYISTVLERKVKQKQETKNSRGSRQEHSYADKLGFLVGGIKEGPTVTCSEEYISYSLECQLKKLSEQLHFDQFVNVNHLVKSWNAVFKKNALSLVAETHRPLIARWLKWSLLTHDLRETLAKHLCVAVIGISNSGKSLLVNSLFNVQAQVGTTQSKKTVVPFLYNMDGQVDNLDVVDFPGIDDKDSMPGLVNLLVSLAQVVLCVVNYKSVNSKSLADLLHQLEKEDIPVLVCITHGDHLCATICKELHAEAEEKPALEKIRHRLEIELKATTETLSRRIVPSRTLKYYCFNKQESDYSENELKEVGVFSISEVGNWLVDTIRDKLDQSTIATSLRQFLKSPTHDTQ